MDKLWKGRFSKELDKFADEFNKSIKFDKLMYKQDITGSIAHAQMLEKQNIISKDDAKKIIKGLNEILIKIEKGKLEINEKFEDIHSFVEAELTKNIGEVGKKLHTARSRNDQVALDLRMYVKQEVLSLIELLKQVVVEIKEKAKISTDAIMPGYTHLQRAQPVSFAHQILSYAMMFLRDIDRLKDNLKRINICPLGSCALAGTTFNTDRDFVAEILEFDDVCQNSIDGVSDRDFCVETLSDLSLIMMHLSRFCEEIILWSSWEFKFVELDDSFSTGSSIMPQKKNPDIAELIRGKTGRVYGSLTSLLTMLKGLPLAYNKDMQEDKEVLFDAIKTTKDCLTIFAPMLSSMSLIKDNMYKACQNGFINATDLADYMVSKNLPFRTAYKIVGEIVAFCIKNNYNLENMPLVEYKKFNKVFENDLYQKIDIKNCVEERISKGGTSSKSVKEQIKFVENKLKE